MNIVEWLQRIMVGFGAAWVMWLMLGLSVISVAVILERAWYFWSLGDDLAILARDLRSALDESVEAAQKRMEASPSVEAAVVVAGLAMADCGPASAEEAMAGAVALQRNKLERRLAYLATLGNNAPFIGLFGTVIGVVQAFAALGEAARTPVAQATSQALAPQRVMSSIAEALVATAVGLAVAIPAVAANNTFQRLIRTKLANTEALTRILLAHVKAVDPAVADEDERDEPPPEPEKAPRAKNGKKQSVPEATAKKSENREPRKRSGKDTAEEDDEQEKG